MRLCFSILYLLISNLAPSTHAQDSVPNVLNLQAWKDQQVLEAQNQVLRVGAKLSALKNSKPNSGTKEALKLGSSRVKQIESDPITITERELKRAHESLQSAQNYGLDEYIAIYLPTIADQNEAISTLTNRLSKEELAEIVKALLKKDPPSDAKRSGSLTTASSALGARSR